MPLRQKRNAPARTGAGASSRMAGRLIATILENLEPAGAAADQVDDHSLFGISVFDRVAELFGTPDALVVYFRDHIAAFDSAAFGRAVGFHFGDDHAIGLQAFEASGEYFAADVFHDDVYPVTTRKFQDTLREVLFAVVDEVMGA